MKEKLSAILCIREDCRILISASNGRVLLLNTAMIPEKATKDNQGVPVMKLTKGTTVVCAEVYEEGSIEEEHHYVPKELPSRGDFLKIAQV